jgi:hypothetical protein
MATATLPAASRHDTDGTEAPGTGHPQAPGEPEAPARGTGRRVLPRLPALGAMTAAAVTGTLVGLATVLLTSGALRGCETVRGTATCGGGPGLLLLVVIFLLSTLIGGVLLRAFGVSDPSSTSLLGVGLLAVIALLFLINVLMSWWMVLVIPLVAAGTFALAHWVTTAFVETTDG